MDDRRLAEKARLGDVDAYEQLVHANQQLAFRVAYAIIRDAAEAEDAIQESFVKAYYALDRFDPGAPFCPWLLRAVGRTRMDCRDGATSGVADRGTGWKIGRGRRCCRSGSTRTTGRW